MILAALLSVTYSIPATAFNMEATPGWVIAARTAAAPQTLVVPSGGDTAVARDNYSVTEVQELAPGAYARTAPTFVNDPGSVIQWPFLVGVPISDDYGPRPAPCSGCSTFHKGIDMTPGVNTPVHAIADGVVVEASRFDNGGLGVYVVIEHDIDGRTVTSTYAHMAAGSLGLAVGDYVGVGQRIGAVGNTGQSTGPHLHLEIAVEGEIIDPYAWLQERV